MSKSFGYVCMTHDRPLSSECWYNHSFDRLSEVLQNKPVILEASKHLEWDNMPPEVSWLLQHPYCHVLICDEYGDSYDEKGNILNEESERI